ncbi:acyl transferase/acyl hydrolase/lysophospholipase [Chytridium lagenaria]|nr:acyl transferase/acyl hydrolase/lysophospholipase [Chytridium lagenaria]
MEADSDGVKTWWDVAKDVVSYWGNKVSTTVLRQHDPRANYKHLMKVATNYEQWAAAGLALDRLEGKETWKNDPRSPDFDYSLLQDRLLQLKRARESEDLASMIFLLRTSISRKLGEMGNPKLYEYCHVGTKKLIEDYIEEVTTILHHICDTDSPDLPLEAKYEFFTNTQRAFGRTALLLSGGATFGLSHIGVIRTLYEAKLLPRIINGSSVGSIVAAYVCTRTDEELPAIFDLKDINMNFFERKHEQSNLFFKLDRLVKHGVLFDVEVFIEAMKDNIGNVTFQEAFNRTRRILNIGVSSSTNFEMPRLLNYLTAPNVVIWSAVAASCAIPFVYRSAPLLMKDRSGRVTSWNPSGHRWIDGSVENDLPMARISELFNVNHFIVAQVNPHILPFMKSTRSETLISKTIASASYLIRSELLHRLHQLAELGISNSLLYRVRAILVQKYYGDITIVPSFSVIDYTKIISNPDLELATAFSITGQRWSPIMKNHCQIELCIDEILYRLRVRKLEGHTASTRNNTKASKRRGLQPMTQVNGAPDAIHIAHRTPSM